MDRDSRTLRLSARRALAFAAAGLLRVSSGQAAEAADALPGPDRVRLAEAFRLADAIGDRIWPGWSQTAFAVVFVTPDREYLIRHPRPPEGFRPLGEDALLQSPVFVRERTFPPNLLATFPINGLSTVVVGQPASTGARSSTAWVVTLLHEHFHQLQDSQPGFFERVEALGLSHGDKTGMWMLDFPFPYDSKKTRAAFQRSARALADVLGSGTNVPAYAAARLAFRATLPEDARTYLDFQIWKEGVARYTEIRVARWAAAHYLPSAEFSALPDFSTFESLAAPSTAEVPAALRKADLSSARRIVFYALGAGEALLLDRIAPCWREDYLRRPFSIDPAFFSKRVCGKGARERG
jgi:hypothetical protein